MTEDSPSTASSQGTPEKSVKAQTGASASMPPEKYARLKAEAKAPYRGLRRFLYLGCAASGAMGAFIFFTQALAGRDVEQALPNLAVQLGVIALMVWLLRVDQAKPKQSSASTKQTHS